MKSIEAKGYFQTLGLLHQDIRKQSKPEGDLFLAGERQTPEYRDALKTLKINSEPHFIRELEGEKALIDSFLNDRQKRMMGLVQLHEPTSRMSSWRILRKLHADLGTLMGIFAKRAEEVREDRPGNGIYTARIFVYGGRQQMRALAERRANILDKRYCDDDISELLALFRFIDAGALDIKVNGVCFNDFAKEDFKNKRKVDAKRILSYLRFFMALGGNFGDLDVEEAIQKQNTDEISTKYPFLYRNVIREANSIAQSFYTLPTIEPHKIPDTFSSLAPSVSEAMQGIKRALVDSKQRFIQLTERINELVFSPNLEGSGEVRNLCRGYLAPDNRYLCQYLLGLMGSATAPALVVAYRKIVDLIEKGSDADFYSTLSLRILELVETHKNFGISTVDELDPVIIPKEILRKTEQVSIDLISTVQQLNKVPNWRNVDIAEIEVPWEETGIKKPATIKLEFPTGSPTTFNLGLGYKNEFGESLDISLRLNLSKKEFDWSIIQDPKKYPDLQVRFLEIISTIFKEIYRQVSPPRKEERRADIVSSVFPTIPRVKPIRPVAFLSPVKLKKGSRETPIQSISATLEDSKEYKIKDHILGANNGYVDALLQGIPNDQKELIVRRITEFNNEGRGRFKRLGTPGPKGERQYSLRIGNYRILLLEQEFSKGTRLYMIRNVGNRNGIYDEVDN